MIDNDLVYLGCYTAASGGAGEGITLARRDRATGALTALGVAAVTPSPSFVTRHPRLPVLYAANELDDGRVSAWVVAGDGGLQPLGDRSTGGASPCHAAVSPDGRYLASANYGGGSVALLPLDDAGAPGERTDLVSHPVGAAPGRNPERQEAAHAHMVSWDPDGQLRVVDLGADTVFRYAVDGGRLRPAGEPLRAPAGTGPRHLARGPGGWLYLAGELDGTVAAYLPDPSTGRAVERARVAATAHSGHVQPSEIAVSADGRFLYLANRGPDTIATFALADGVPEYLAEVPTSGRWPRHFALSDRFLYVANERSDTVVTLEIPPSGVPVATGSVLELGTPTCVSVADSAAR